MKKTQYLLVLVSMFMASACVSSRLRTSVVEGYQGPISEKKVHISIEALPKFKYMLESVFAKELKKGFEQRDLTVSQIILNKPESEAIQKLNEKVIFNTDADYILRVSQIDEGLASIMISPPSMNDNNMLTPATYSFKEYTYFEFQFVDRQTSFIIWTANGSTTRDYRGTSDEQAILKLAEKVIKKLEKDAIIATLNDKQ